MITYTPSHSYLIQPVQNNQIYSMVSNIPLDQVALVILGGGVTTNEKRSAGYIKHILPFIQDSGLINVNVYGVVYSFGSLDSDLLKVNLFRRAGRKVKFNADNAEQQEIKLKQINENEPIPEYILDLYDALIEPRIVHGNVIATSKNMRNLIFYNHCHGAVALSLLSEVTRINLKNAGFDDASVRNILKNIVAIQHNPVGPLENPLVTTINFLSASDDVLNYYNAFSENVLGKHDLEPSFFGNEYGNIFVAGQLKSHTGSEHGFSDGYKPDAEQQLTANGQIIYSAEKNAIKNAITAAQNNTPIPSTEQFVSGTMINFAKMKSNGDKLNNAMLVAAHKSKNNLLK